MQPNAIIVDRIIGGWWATLPLPEISVRSGWAVIQAEPEQIFTAAFSELQLRGGLRSPWSSSIRAAFLRERVGQWFRETRF